MKTITSLVTLALLLFCMSSKAAFYQFQFATTNGPLAVTNIIKEIAGTVVGGGTAQWYTNAAGTLATNTYSKGNISINAGGGLTATSFTGSGSGLTSISVPDSALQPDVSLLGQTIDLASEVTGSLPATSLSGTVPVAQLPVPVLVSTNWISGKLYTNLTGRLQYVQVSVSCTAASVAGGAVQRLWVSGLTVAQFGAQTISGSLAVTNTGIVGGYVGTGLQFTFTNAVGGAGDTAINLTGTGQQVTY